MHDFELEHEHDGLSDAEQEAIARSILEQETITLRTVGIDIGSSTSHLLFARVVLQRQSQDLSSRFVVVEREIIWHSPILLTPFRIDGTIDAHALAHFIRDAYHDAGLRRGDIDSGAVILTGEAIKRKNARAIDEIFAKEAGKFVCATAGHKLECILAAHGSGAVALSRRRGAAALHVDIGGGTTKLALIDRGEIKSVAALAVGGRLLATDETGAWTRIDDSARLVARDLGIAAAPDRMADESARRAIAGRLAGLVVDQIVGAPLDDLGRALELTEPLERSVPPEFISFSGGVAEYIFRREAADFGDIARRLAGEILRQMKERCRVPVTEPKERIRATVIGASQFTVQVSGKTIYLSHENVLPVNNIPVVHLGLDLSGEIDEDAIVDAFGESADILDLAPDAKMALAFTFSGEPNYPRLAAIARSIMRFAAPARSRGELLVLMIEGDVGRALGRIIHEELGLEGTLISVDGIRLQQLDFVDIGELIEPPGVVPVVIKSLLFSRG
jgi:ethanolamine utilization protein EutA